jgi:hypothetical protein
MALSSPSLFVYGLVIDNTNQFITFTNSTSTYTVTVIPGYYSLTNLGKAIVQAFQSVDPINTYTFSVNRTISGGTENRITLTSTDTVFSLLFATGVASNPASLIGFSPLDYTGALNYTGFASAGSTLIPNQLAYTFLSTENKIKNYGVRNISASGLKETITFAIQYFLQAQFKYIPEQTYESEWYPFVQWAIQQRPFEFTPEISSPTVFYNVTFDDPDQGMSFTAPEMLPDFPGLYSTPLMVFRQIPS